MTEQQIDIVEKQPTEVSKDDLAGLKDLKAKAIASTTAAKVDELEFRNAILNVFLEYNLKKDDSFDENTGVITRN